MSCRHHRLQRTVVPLLKSAGDAGLLSLADLLRRLDRHARCAPVLAKGELGRILEDDLLRVVRGRLLSATQLDARLAHLLQVALGVCCLCGQV